MLVQYTWFCVLVLLKSNLKSCIYSSVVKFSVFYRAYKFPRESWITEDLKASV